MSGNLYVSAAGVQARLLQLETISNNLANADTLGFRADQLSFETALEAALLDGAPGSPRGRSFVGIEGLRVRQTPGTVQRTGRELDVAVQGDGFFRVSTPAGVRYTRSGAFHVDGNGTLVTATGHPVLGAAGPIDVGDRPVRIQPDGTVLDDQSEVIGTLSLVEFLDLDLLRKEGANLFEAPAEAVGLPVEPVTLVPGAVEGSNVQPLQELARLISVQRAYDATMRAMQADDESSSRLIQEVLQ